MNHDCKKNISTLRNGVLIYTCNDCTTQSYTQGSSAAFDRRAMQTQFRQDLIQPNNPQQFVKAVGIERAREAGYSEEQLRKYA